MDKFTFFLTKKVNLLFFTPDLLFYLFLQKKVNLSKKKSKPVRKKVNDGEKKVIFFFNPHLLFLFKGFTFFMDTFTFFL